MAKRLNKKVAIIGLLVLGMLMAAAMVVMLKLSRNPQKYIADAQAALALSEPDYKAAEKAYGRAFAYAKDTNLKIDILFKLAKMYLDINEWPKAAGCWNRIINYDTKNIKARLALLDYSYQLAEAGNWVVWKDVESNVSELIDKELDTSPRMYRIKGQALLELVKHGQMTDKESAVKNTIEILKKVNQDEPNNVSVYQYLADAITQQGKILAAKGVIDALDNASQEAVNVLIKGVENIPGEPQSYLNLYSTRFAEAGTNPDKFKELESDLVDLTEKFSNSALPYFAMTQLYQMSPKDIDKAIATVEKAMGLDRQNVSYALTAANLYYRRYSVSKSEDDFKKAIDIANEALGFPDSLDLPGPKARISFINRYMLHTFLADCFVEKAIDAPVGQPEKSKWIESAENETRQINQMLGSAENPYVIMWQGRLLLARGQENDAIVKMNAAYEALTASGQAQEDPQLGRLSYELATVLSDSPEEGAVFQFYSTAIKNKLYYTKPEILLDFASVAALVNDWQSVLGAMDYFETNFSKNERSINLRIRAYVGTGMFEKAQELVDKLPMRDPNTIRLKIGLLNNKLGRTNWRLVQDVNGLQQQLKPTESREQLKTKRDTITKERDDLKNELALTGAANISEQEVIDICRRYISEEQIDKSKKLVEDFLLIHPNSVNIRLYRLMLAEPAPANVPPQRVDQLTVKAMESLDEPLRRASLLGQFYQIGGQKDKAVEYYQQVLQLEPNNTLAIAGLFDIATSNNDFKQAEKMAETARQNNIDRCEGEYFKARLAFVKKEYQTALERINNCLEKRPIFSQAYLLRSQINTALEKESDAIDDIKKAYSLNPLDKAITRNLAFLLYNRNRKFGASASPDQLTEARTALEAAIRSNPADYGIQSFYAEYIGDTDPQRAIAICQQIQKIRPSVENSLVLGKLALKAAEQNKVKAQKSVYLSVAEDAYKKAGELAPQDTRVLLGYSEFLKVTGRTDEAEKLLADQNDLLWRFYIRAGKLDEAQRLLTQIYESNPKDVNIVRGLILVSKNKGDHANVLKYTDDLLKIDNSVENQIIGVEAYLEEGRVDDAQARLDSLTERYPDDPRAVLLRSLCLARQGKLEDSLKLANKYLETDKNNSRVWQLRGQVNLALSNLNQAIDDLQKSKAIQDNSEVRIDLARAYIRSGKEEEAIAELKTAADEQGSLVARNMLEEAYMITGKQDRLEKFYTEMIEKTPDNVYWYNRAGELALFRKDFDKAFMFFDTAFKNSFKVNSESPDAQAFEGRLRVFLEAKKYDQLFADATKYLEGPLAAVAYARMADAKAQMGDKDTASQYFRRALEKTVENEAYLINILRYMTQVVGIDETMKWCNERLQSQPDSLAVNFALYNLYKIAGENIKAIEYLDNCIRIAAGDEKIDYQVNKASYLFELYSKTADKTYQKQVIEEYESILKKKPTNISVLNNLAYMLAETDTDVGKALEYIEKAYNAKSNSPEVLDTYGYVLMKSGKAQLADEFLQRALQQYEQNQINAPIEVYEHVGKIKEKLGQDAEALKAYELAMELAGENAPQEVKNRISAEIEKVSSKK